MQVKLATQAMAFTVTESCHLDDAQGEKSRSPASLRPDRSSRTNPSSWRTLHISWNETANVAFVRYPT